MFDGPMDDSRPSRDWRYQERGSTPESRGRIRSFFDRHYLIGPVSIFVVAAVGIGYAENRSHNSEATEDYTQQLGSACLAPTIFGSEHNPDIWTTSNSDGTHFFHAGSTIDKVHVDTTDQETPKSLVLRYTLQADQAVLIGADDYTKHFLTVNGCNQPK